MGNATSNVRFAESRVPLYARRLCHEAKREVWPILYPRRARTGTAVARNVLDESTLWSRDRQMGCQGCEHRMVRTRNRCVSPARPHRYSMVAVSYTHLTLPTKRIV